MDGFANGSALIGARNQMITSTHFCIHLSVHKLADADRARLRAAGPHLLRLLVADVVAGRRDRRSPGLGQYRGRAGSDGVSAGTAAVPPPQADAPRAARWRDARDATGAVGRAPGGRHDRLVLRETEVVCDKSDERIGVLRIPKCKVEKRGRRGRRHTALRGAA